MTQPATAILPARPEFNEQGVPMSPFFGDVYHATDGGLGQARHVFLGGNGLPQRWRERESFVILETGFGLGLNFLATWQAWREDPQRCRRLHFVSAEKHPFQAADLAQLHQRWPELAERSAELLRNWPPLTPGCHRILLNEGRVTLTLYFGDLLKLAPKIAVQADALYLDGFAPAKNPELWTPGLLRTLTRHCAPRATLATWCLAANVQRALSHHGWALEKPPGFGRRREMLTGHLPAERRHTMPRRGGAASLAPSSSVIVIGAGIAGCAAAERLAARGWQVQVLESHPAAAMATSGNPVGLMHPALAKDDNFMARITRACTLYATRLLRTLETEETGLLWSPRGLLQLARDHSQEEDQRHTVESLGFPADYVRYVDAAEAGALAGATLATGGWYFPDGGWLSPPTLCQALLARWPAQLTARYNCAVASLRRQGDQWQALDADGAVIAEAPTIVFASAFDTMLFMPGLPLARIRGQISLLDAGTLPDLKLPLCGNGYLTPAVAGRHCFGATYDFDQDDPLPRADSHLANLDHLKALLPGVDTTAFDPGRMAGRVGFRTATIDRLPMVGPLPDEGAFLADPLRREAQLLEVPRHPGLHCLVGLGSRGMVWAPLAAELLASRLAGEPLPLERDLADALDPARFLLRAQRRATPVPVETYE
ncbi:MAG: bifunctional tRNA (5-methylaminomethyl-2-thiouridine)(34)-methyltransferase MnmD/FAD-dependent 5-carboxymethylaminomethyl-2-thiouridine(34) oxidoreductase MnmC [Rhodocyclaceae bacterium]|nr:MAG: bifunctional tRNA (5-methylaminomethyl-2-thiouridine)(34)-methyltransferase MnmD/FAD-dependent 5-carboxymethylaminomethyl-2-thiouridine(34) oxidoreductase MnmC [Rhodocyclaceae bacterium]